MDYKIIKELGRGGFGVVSEVTDENNNHFALKRFEPNADIKLIIQKGHTSEDDLKKRFLKEIRYQSQVNNPNVVKIIDHGTDQNTPWYLMELASGTLQVALSKDKVFNPDIKKALFDILSGMEAIHEIGIVHRDLKPVNILKIKNADSSYRYAISDFGLITATHSDTTTITKTGHGGGTAMYAAPELITHFKHATPAADIYSFGAILHDIFGSGSRTPYSQLNVPGPCRDIVEKCTYKNVARRYQDISSLRLDLFTVLDNPLLEFSTSEEKEIIELLNRNDNLTPDEWDRYFEILGNLSEFTPTTHNLFKSTRKEHFQSINASDPGLLHPLGMEFSNFVRSLQHDFNYCDVLADKIEALFHIGNIELKAHCLLTFLIMGVNHNRWFVERKFQNLSGADCDSKVIKRLLVDIETESIDLDNLIRRWEISINSTRNKLHPEIVQKLASENVN